MKNISYIPGPFYKSFITIMACCILIAPMHSQPANDLCVGAIEVICGTDITVSGDNATNTDAPQGCTEEVINLGGLWYKFIGDGQNWDLTLTQLDDTDKVMQLVSGSCGAFACEGLTSTDGQGISKSISINTEISENYYIYLSGLTESVNSAGLMIECHSPVPFPLNDDCSTAEHLDCSNIYTPFVGTTIVAKPDNPGCSAMGGRGVWYTFPGNNTALTFSMCGTISETYDMRIFSGNCSMLTCEVQNTDEAPNCEITVLTEAGTNYFLYVGFANYTTGDFELTIESSDYALNVTETHIDVSCFGLADGSIDLDVSGGHPPYVFLWDDGAMVEDRENLAPGFYVVTINDAGGCAVQSIVRIIEPEPLMLTESHTDVTCQGTGDGSIDLTVTGGTQPYSYSWSNGEVSEDMVELDLGTYTVVITDLNDCSDTLDVVIDQLDQLLISEVHGDASCYSGSDGYIDLTVSGGTPPYTFIWDHGEITEDLTDLVAAPYIVTAKDVNGCEGQLEIVIGQPDELLLSETHENVSCFGFADGSIDLTVNGGISPYTYLWNNGAFTQDMEFIDAGDYTVTVTDNNGCTAEITVVVEEVDPLQLSETHLDVTCAGPGNDGSIDLTVNGGNPPYHFAWNNGATTEDIQELTEGGYTVVVTDDNDCMDSLTISIGLDNDPLLLDAIVQHISCFGYADGAIDLELLDGTPPYEFAWDHGESSEDLSDLPAGTYTVVVTDESGCMGEITAEVIEPSVLQLTATHINVSCSGPGNDGSIDLTVNGGSPPYNYAWSNGETTEDIEGLTVGDYAVVVTDDNDCVDSLTVSITTEDDPLMIEAVVQQVSCFGYSDGAIDIEVAGGIPPYNYEWSNGETTEDIIDQTAGTYTVVVTDMIGCMGELTLEVGEPEPVQVAEVHTNVSCLGAADGSIDITVVSGIPPYNYSWNNGATIEDLEGMTAGIYEVEVTDADGCIGDLTVEITEPDILQITETHIDVSCFGYNDGSINVTVTGGTAPYIFSWSNGSDAEDLVDLFAGNYVLIVIDVSGCTQAISVDIDQPDQLAIMEVHTDVTCHGLNDGSIDLTVNGGSMPYVYAWSNSATTEDLADLFAGTYGVTVTDASGCTEAASININQPDQLMITETHTDVSCTGPGNDGSIDLTVTGGVPAGTPPYFYSWANGADFEDLDNLSVGVYGVEVTDGNGCTESLDILLDTYFESNLLTNRMACIGDTIHFIDISDTSVHIDVYEWDFGDGITSSDRDPVHVYTNTGEFEVEITASSDECGTFSMSKTVIVEPCRRNIFNEANFSYINIYPNPTMGLVHVEVELLDDMDLAISIYNINGVLIDSRYYRQQWLTESFALEDEGIYFFRISAAFSTKTMKVIVQ